MMPTAPVTSKDRIVSLDVLRGFALLGILVMNIQSFSMPMAAYGNPTAFGDLTGINLRVWQFSHIFFDTKFMSLFSLLFGAGVLLFIERARARGASAGFLHFRRSGWLIAFGLLHAHLLWFGDILYFYGVCALLIFLFRNASPRKLAISALIFLAIGSGMSLSAGFTWDQWEEPHRLDMARDWQPSTESIDEEIAAFTGGFEAWIGLNRTVATFMETFVLFFMLLWNVTGLMLLGMALYRWRVLSGERDAVFYRRLLAIGSISGISLVVIGMVKNEAAGYSVEYSKFIGSQWNYWGGVALALGYVGLVIGMVRKGALPGLQRRLAAVGRMAFTNYIMHTVLAVIIFRSFGLFGQVERSQQLAIVVAIWILQLWLSPLWLARYRFGPLEWLWRSLTYWQMQPFLRS
ncbi:MAG TPA: DUF418 domain-containing protein [Planctomycetes bacterium]|nr:DUF418 domain-containing protein [Planctomycetota bacterium]